MESRWQILAGGALAVFLVVSLTAAVLYLPTLSTNTSSNSTTTGTTATSSAPVTIYVSTITTTTIQSATPKTQTLTHTVTESQSQSTTTVFQTVTATAPGNGTGSCPIFGGSGTPLYCVPLTISNSQLSPITAGTQIMLRADWQEYGAYLTSNVGNVVFADASGNPVYTWCESSCSNTQPVSNIWIKEDAPIPASGQQKMYMYIFPLSQIQYNASGYWGAFPIITGTYGQYDNGPKVFDFYNNFNGSSLCSCLTAVPFLGGEFSGGRANYSVGNGLTITATGAPSGAGFGYHVYLNTREPFTAIDSNVVATDLPTNVSLEAAYRYDAMDLTAPGTNYLDNGFYSSYSALNFVCGCGNSFSIHLDQGAGENGSTVISGKFQPWVGVQSFVWTGNGSEFANEMELQQLHGTNGTLSLTPDFADIAFINGLPSQHYMTFHWMRTRNSPSNDVMPSASFGTISSY